MNKLKLSFDKIPVEPVYWPDRVTTLLIVITFFGVFGGAYEMYSSELMPKGERWVIASILIGSLFGMFGAGGLFYGVSIFGVISTVIAMVAGNLPWVLPAICAILFPWLIWVSDKKNNVIDVSSISIGLLLGALFEISLWTTAALLIIVLLFVFSDIAAFIRRIYKALLIAFPESRVLLGIRQGIRYFAGYIIVIGGTLLAIGSIILLFKFASIAASFAR